MKTKEENQQQRKLNLPELANPINSNIKNENFNAASPCNIVVFIGYHS